MDRIIHGRASFRLLLNPLRRGKRKKRRAAEPLLCPLSSASFQAFAVSIASRVGTGNLAGVATAIAIGGPGAVFLVKTSPQNRKYSIFFIFSELNSCKDKHISQMTAYIKLNRKILFI